MTNSCFSALVCLLLGFGAIAKAGIMPSDSTKEGFAVIPLFYYTPDTRFALGAAGVYYFRSKSTREEVPEPRLSYIQLLGDYTQNQQLDVWALWSVFTRNEDYLLRGELRYRNFPDRFYGVGNRTAPTMMERYYYDLISIKALFMRRLSKYLFAGFDYNFRREYNFSYSDDKVLANGGVTGAAGGLGSAFGAVVTYDSRDNVVNAFKGRFFEFSSYYYHQNFGGSFNFVSLNTVYNVYKELQPGLIWASNVKLVMNYGEVPFLDMAKVGGDDMLRGYAANRFRDHHFFGAQTELRKSVYKRFGVVGFVGVGDVLRTVDDVGLGTLKYSIGTGIRYALNKSERLNVRLDYGWGRGNSSFYFSVAEAF